jgi:hypothetical protein
LPQETRKSTKSDPYKNIRGTAFAIRGIPFVILYFPKDWTPVLGVDTKSDNHII